MFEQIVLVAQSRSLVAVAAIFSHCVGASHIVSGEHVRSLSSEGALLSYCVLK
jgi:hypothetical protein